MVKVRPELAPIEVYTCGDRTLKLLFNEYSDGDFPGLVALWVCECESSSRDCLILIANLAQLRQWLFQLQRRTGEQPEQRSFRRALEIKARAAIREQQHINATHLLMIGAIQKTPLSLTHGEFRALDCCGAWLVDFVGDHLYYGQNAISYKVGRSIAKKVAEIGSGPLLTWEEIVFGEQMPWLSWAEQFARAYMKSKTHRIQPPKAGRGNGKS